MNTQTSDTPCTSNEDQNGGADRLANGNAQRLPAGCILSHQIAQPCNETRGRELWLSVRDRGTGSTRRRRDSRSIGVSFVIQSYASWTCEAIFVRKVDAQSLPETRSSDDAAELQAMFCRWKNSRSQARRWPPIGRRMTIHRYRNCCDSVNPFAANSFLILSVQPNCSMLVNTVILRSW